LPPPDELRRSDSTDFLKEISKKKAKTPSAEPWVMARSLARPMNRLTPDGVVRLTPDGAKEAVDGADPDSPLPARWRPLNWTRSINMRSVSSTNLAATAPAAEIASVGTTMKAKLLAYHRDRARKAALHDNPPMESDNEDKLKTIAYSHKKEAATPELKRGNRWRASSFEFEDVLTDLIKPKKDALNMTLPANFKSPTMNASPSPGTKRRHDRPKTVMPMTLDDAPQLSRAAGGRSGAQMEEKKSESTEVKSKMMHATRNLVQRVTLDAQTIC